MDPTTDPEAPAESEEPTDIESGSTVDSSEVTAVDDEHTITITDYKDLKSQVTVTASNDLTVSRDGKITFKETEAGINVTLTVAAKEGYKIKSVKSGDTEGTTADKGKNYTLALTALKADATVEITTAQVYTVNVSNGGETTLGIKLDKTLNAAAGEAETADVTIADKGSKELEKGAALKFTVDGTRTPDTQIKVAYITDESDGEDPTPIDAEDIKDDDGKVTGQSFTVKKEVIDSLESSIEIIIAEEAQESLTITKNADVTVSVANTSADATTKPWKELADADYTGGVYTAKDYKDKAFQFKAALAEAKAAAYDLEVVATDTKGKTKTLEAAEGVYEVKLGETAGISFKLVYKSTVLNTVNLGVATGCDTDSATFTVTSITIPDAENEGQDKDLSTLATMKDYLIGLELKEDADSIKLKAGDSFKVPDDVKKITVKVDAAEGYQLAKLDDSNVAGASRTYTIVKTLTSPAVATEVAFANKAAALTVATEIPKTEGKKGFTVSVDDAESAAAEKVFGEITPTGATKKTSGENVYYEVAKDASTVQFTVDLTEGYEIPAALKDNAMVKSVDAAAAANGKVKYTIVLFASKLADIGDEDDAATAFGKADKNKIALTHIAIKYTAALDEESAKNQAKFSIKVETKAFNAAADAKYEEVEKGLTDPFDYGVAWKATIAAANEKDPIEKVSYKLGDEVKEVSPRLNDDTDKPEYIIDIPKLTANVVITVENGQTYSLETLKKVGTGTIADGYTLTDVSYTNDEDGIYAAEYGARYAIGVKEGTAFADAKKISVTVTGPDGVIAMSTPIIKDAVNTSNTYRTINLNNKKLEGKEIDVAVSYDGKPVDTYTLSVKDKTTSIKVNNGEAISLPVGTTETYPIETVGEPMANAELTVEPVDRTADVDINQYIRAEIEDNKLIVTVVPANRGQVMKEVPLESDPTKKEWVAKEAKVTIEADEAEVVVPISATTLFDEEAAPDVQLVSAADTTLDVKVDMADVTTPQTGSVWYKVTATPRDAKEGETKPATVKADTQIVERTGDSTKVKLNVNTKLNLGEGVYWDYNVTAQMFYMSGDAEDYDDTSEITEAASVAHSKASETQEFATKAGSELKFEDALKLKKEKGASKLYTGQDTETVVATLNWKNDSYKALGDDGLNNYEIYEDGYGLELTVSADGKQLLVTGVSDTAKLGKHTITVIAAADRTGDNEEMGKSHTTFASRATVVVNVVKGINELDVAVPSNQIYKDQTSARPKAATLKTTVIYNENKSSWNGKDSSNPKNRVTAPANKKVTWSIVDARSEWDCDTQTGNIIAAPEYLHVNNNGKTADNGVGVKNGVVTVGKSFKNDPKHANNNRFKVMVQAAEACPSKDIIGLSEMIEITGTPLDISKLVIVHDNKVSATHDIADRDPAEVLASDVDGGYIYAVGGDVKVGDNWTIVTRRGVKYAPIENLTMTTTNKKVLQVGDYDGRSWVPNKVKVLAAGKKAGIKVTANDGGKQKAHTINLTLGAKDTKGFDLGLMISADGTDKTFNPVSTKTDTTAASKANVKETPVEWHYDVTGAAKLRVSLVVGNKEKDSDKYESAGDIKFTSYKLAVKGGKVFENKDGRAVIVSTAKDTTLTLTDQSAEAKTAKKKAYVYKLVNDAYTKEQKAPKVKVLNALHTGGTEEEQTVELSVGDAANKGAAFADTKKVKVEVDWSTETVKNKSTLSTLNTMLRTKSNSSTYVFDTKDGIVKLPLGPASYKAGSYKVKVTVGTLSGTKFTAETLPATTAIKVTQNKAFTFKPATSYTINKLDGGAVLTGKSNVNVKLGETAKTSFYKLENVNVKGTSNKFTHYFKIVDDKLTGTQRLALNTDDYEVQKMLYPVKTNAAGEETIGADGNPVLDLDHPYDNPKIEISNPKDLEGYVYFSAKPSVNYYTNSAYGVSGYVKIKVKLAKEAEPGKMKPSQKYVPEKAEVGLTEKNNTTQVNIVVNGSYVGVAYAMIDTTKKNAPELSLVDTGSGKAKKLGANENGQVVVKASAEVKAGKSYSTNLLIVPESSFYKKLIEDAEPAAATAAKAGETEAPAEPAPSETKEDLIRKYGIAVKISIVASENPNPTKVPKDLEIPADIMTKVSGATAVLTAEDVNEDRLTTAGNTKVADAIKSALGTEAANYTVVVDNALDINEATGKATLEVTISRNGYKTGSTDVTVTMPAEEEPEPQVIYTVTITAPTVDNAKVTKGGSLTCAAKVEKTEDGTTTEVSNPVITWEVTGNVSDDTKFGENGELTVAAGETAEKLSITASYTPEGGAAVTSTSVEVSVETVTS